MVTNGIVCLNRGNYHYYYYHCCYCYIIIIIILCERSASSLSFFLPISENFCTGSENIFGRHKVLCAKYSNGSTNDLYVKR